MVLAGFHAHETMRRLVEKDADAFVAADHSADQREVGMLRAGECSYVIRMGVAEGDALKCQPR